MNFRFLKNLAALGLAAIALPALAQTASPLGKLPLFFEANRGQSESAAPFLARTADAECAISIADVAMDLRRAGGPSGRLQMKFVGANPAAEIHGDAEQPGKINYLLGNDPARWHPGVPTFAKVRVEKIYPGVDVVFYGNQHQLEYDFYFSAGADPKRVALRFDGADKIRVDGQGELVVAVGGVEIRQPSPGVYQMIGGQRHAVAGAYEMVAADTVGFKVGSYDPALPLVIDPVLSYSTFFGGSSGETAWATALNPNDGSIYVAGQTFSSQVSSNQFFRATPGAYQTNFHGGTLAGDAFVARLDAGGTNLIYLTYLGGSADDAAYGIAVDGAGSAYVCGATDSGNFPTTNSIPGGGAIHGMPDPTINVYPSDAFVAKLDAGGSNLLYSSYLGGESFDTAYGIALDAATNAIVTGFTYSTHFPVTTNTAYQPRIGRTNSYYAYYCNAFITVLSPAGTGLSYSSYFGGTNVDVGRAVSFNDGTIFIAGNTASKNFPTANAIAGFKYLNASSNAVNLSSDAFVAAFTDATLSTPGGGYSDFTLSLLYSTLLGSTNSDIAYGIAADAAGNAYVVGSTTSGFFPSSNTIATNVLTSYVRTNTLNAPATNAFIAQVKWNGTNAYLGYAAVFGGYGSDVATAVAVDAAGNAFVTGYASSTNFPVTKQDIFGSLRATNSGYSDVFVIAFNPNASALIYSTYLGGSGGDYAYGIAVDSEDSAYIVGRTASTNFPVFNARQSKRNGTNDAFLAKITLDSPTLNASLSGTNFLVTVPPVGDISSNSLTLETVTNLLTPVVVTNRVVATNLLTEALATNRVVATNWIAAPKWVVLTNQPVLTNGAFTFRFDPTNGERFFRFHK